MPAPDRPPTIQCGVRSLNRSTSGVSPSCPTVVPSPSAASPLHSCSAGSGSRSARVTWEAAAEWAASSRHTASTRWAGGSSSRKTGAFSHDTRPGPSRTSPPGGSPITAYGLRSETVVVRGSGAWVVSAVSGGGGQPATIRCSPDSGPCWASAAIRTRSAPSVSSGRLAMTSSMHPVAPAPADRAGRAPGAATSRPRPARPAARARSVAGGDISPASASAANGREDRAAARRRPPRGPAATRPARPPAAAAAGSAAARRPGDRGRPRRR